MSDLDSIGIGRDRAGAATIVDPGLRAYMLHIYNYMVLGLAVTGCAALATYALSVTDDPALMAARLRDGLMLTPFGKAVFLGPLKWVVILAPLALVFVLSFGIERMRPAVAQVVFWIYAGLIGVSFGSIFLVFTHTSIVRVFFITAASFGSLSLLGYSTSRDLTGFGSFLIMGLFGVVLAGIANLFLASSALQFAVSVVGVLVFAGLTAWDTQRLKNEYIYGGLDGDVAERSAIMGALSLYLNFINLFTLLLQLLGQRDQ
jgi:FtsH-binding integral membrane protein